MANTLQHDSFSKRDAFLAFTRDIEQWSWENEQAAKQVLKAEDEALIFASRRYYGNSVRLGLPSSIPNLWHAVVKTYSVSTRATVVSMVSGDVCNHERIEAAIKEWRKIAGQMMPELPEARLFMEMISSIDKKLPDEMERELEEALGQEMSSAAETSDEDDNELFIRNQSTRKRRPNSTNANRKPEKRIRADCEEITSGDGSHKQPDVQSRAIRTLITPRPMASIEPSTVSIAEDRTKNLGFVSIKTVASIEPSENPEPEVRPTGQNMAPESQSSDEPERIEGDLDTSEQSTATNRSTTGAQTQSSQRASMPEMEELRSEFVGKSDFAQMRKSQRKMLKHISKRVSKGISKGISKQKSMRADKKEVKKLAKKLAKLEKRVGKLKG